MPLPATGYVPEGIPGYQPDQTPYPYDPEAAKAIIAGLGNVPTLSYWYNTDEGHQKIGRGAAGRLDRRPALDVKLSNFEWGTFLDKLSKGNAGSGSQVFRMGWIADYPSMDNFLYPLFQSASRVPTATRFYSNPQFDDAARAGASDGRRRRSATTCTRRPRSSCSPTCPASRSYYYRDFRVTNNRIGNFIHDPMGFTDMWTLWVK